LSSVARRLAIAPSLEAERRFVPHGAPWWMYVALRDAKCVGP
jgi:hypothetical protein